MPEVVTLIDAHVHLRPSHDPARVLDGAVAHFERASTRLGAATCEGVLMLTEAQGEHGFDRLASADAPVGRWRVEPTGDPLTIRCVREDQSEIMVVNGRQVATRDGLEVLTLASGVEIDDGLGIEETIERGLGAGALVTLPWGFGKWTGQRKGRMLDIVRRFGPRGVVLGDSAGRPAGLGEGAIFRLAREMGVPILPGTDPLPIPGHAERAGRYGLWLEGKLDQRSISADLRERLAVPRGHDAAIGRRDGLVASILTQFRLRLG